MRARDGTAAVVASFGAQHPRVRCISSHHDRGFGYAVRAGLERFDGDAVVVMMADGSDAPADVVKYYGVLEEGYDCAFGSRFIRGSVVHDYPKAKRVLNRGANLVVRMLFRHGYNDTTNAFKGTDVR